MTPPDRLTPDGRSAWPVTALWERLEPLMPGITIEVVDELPSTNSELLDRLRAVARLAGDREVRSDDLRPTMLVARQQTAGRGRQGRVWQSEEGGSLTFSLRYVMRRADWSGLSLAIGLELARAFDPDGQRVAVKWPNDLWMRDDAAPGRKFGGILVETLSLGSRRVAVIGVGLNTQPPRYAPNPVASLCELLPAWAEPVPVFEVAAAAVLRAVAAFEQHGFAPMRPDYEARDLLRGRMVTTTDPRCPEGVCDGVSDSGALRVCDAQGTPIEVISGEVSVRPLADPGTP